MRLQDGEQSADTRAVQLFSDRLQQFSLGEADLLLSHHGMVGMCEMS